MSSDPDAQVTEHINNHARAANQLTDLLANVSKGLKAAMNNPEAELRGPEAGQAIEFLNGMTRLTDDTAAVAGRLSWDLYVQQAADAQKNQNP